MCLFAVQSPHPGRRHRTHEGEGEGRDDVLLDEILGAGRVADLDLFNRVQLCEVLRMCRRSPTTLAAGRTLFAASLARRRTRNDADRLTKYLGRFGLRWADVG